MLALFITILTTAWLISIRAADASTTYTYNVHASVVFARAGEHIPFIGSQSPGQLTSLGANQSHSLGSWFRQRYINNGDLDHLPPAPIEGLSAWRVDLDQVFAMALDEQYIVGSAQAFLQGLYPPYSLTKGSAALLDPSSVVNDTYLEFPLGGYQYAQIHSVSALDANSIWLAGQGDCLKYRLSAAAYISSDPASGIDAQSHALFEALGNATLTDVLVDGRWDYSNSLSIYDYLSYQYVHNNTIRDVLNSPPYSGMLTQLRYLSDTLAWATNTAPASSGGNPATSIRTISGQTLAAKILELLKKNIQMRGISPKLALLFGDYEPLMSLASLLSLQHLEPDFMGLALPGSSLVFELFSYDANSTVPESSYPDTDTLWVRCLFRNGTADGAQMIAHPMFNRGPSQTDMSWKEFESAMKKVSLGKVGDWCNACKAWSIFCAAFNASYIAVIGDGDEDDGASSAGKEGRSSISPPVAGVLGAVVTLVVAALLFAVVMLLGGLRLHRVSGGRGAKRRGDLGGFKGSMKLASDQDLTVPKGGPGITIEPVGKAEGHERAGSWELKNTEAGKAGEMHKPQSVRRPSFEEDDGDLGEPVKPDERV